MGKIELTPPAPPIHGSLAFRAAQALAASLGGEASVECPVLTEIGVRVPDAVWVPEGRRAELRGRQPLTTAPEICVEVLSPTNTPEELEQKTDAYLRAGAWEVIWIDPDRRTVRFFTTDGEQPASRFTVSLDSLAN